MNGLNFAGWHVTELARRPDLVGHNPWLFMSQRLADHVEKRTGQVLLPEPLGEYHCSLRGESHRRYHWRWYGR